MSRENFEHFIDEKSFTFQKNGNLETDEQSAGLTNEHSNILCSRIINPNTGEDFKVIGHKYDSLGRRVIFFLRDEEKNISEIGQIKFRSEINNIDDIDRVCGCDVESILSEPLENIKQEELCKYEPILKDCNECLNFSIDWPIHDIVLTTDQLGSVLYWTDGVNPYRYLKLDEIEHYMAEEVPCGDDISTDCLDCEKLRVFNLYDRPYIHVEAITTGGNLRRGTYYFTVAYTNVKGDELTSYESMTGRVTLFDKNKNILEQPDLFNPTNYSIKLKLENLDKRFNYYKIAVIQNTASGGYMAYELPVQSTDNDTLLYSTTDNKDTISLNRILTPKPIYKTVDSITSANNYLLAYGLKEHRKINIQPIANLMGSLVKWGSFVAPESLYADGSRDAVFIGYMRDEVYPLSFRLGTDEGYVTPLAPLISRPATDYDLEEITQNMDEYMNLLSIQETSSSCIKSERTKRWQLFNTATVSPALVDDDGMPVDQQCEAEEMDGETVVIDGETASRIENYIIKQEENVTWVIEPDGPYDNLGDWILNNQDYIRNSVRVTNNHSNIVALLSQFRSGVQEGIPVTPFTIDNERALAEEAGYCFTPEHQPDKDELVFGGIEGEEIESIPKIYPTEYDPIKEDICEMYVVQKRKLVVDVSPHSNRGSTIDSTIYMRNSSISGESCKDARSINDLSQVPVVFNYMFTSEGAEDLMSLEPAQVHTHYSNEFEQNTDVFLEFIHANAEWLEYEFEEGEDEVYIEITQVSGTCKRDEATSFSDVMRYHIYQNCSTVVESGYYNATSGKMMTFRREDFPGGKVRIVLDSPITYRMYSWYWYNDKGEKRPHSERALAATTPSGSFKVIKRDIEYKRIEVTFDKLYFTKMEYYKTRCNYFVPDMGNCDPQPFQQGKFGYVESLSQYPDNKELYDSSWLDIEPSDIPWEYRGEFEDYYVSGIEEGKYKWKTDENGKPITDFRCSNIRHFKFPDNTVSPFMNQFPLTPFDDSIIYPLGVYIDKKLIRAFINIAVKNGIITEEEKDKIKYFEVFRGDRSLEKSIIYKGIASDMIKDPTEKDTYFRNFPYNDLGRNKYLYDKSKNEIMHPFSSRKNNRFSLTAPEVYINKPNPGTEVSIEGYMYGNSMGRFKPVEDHSKWVILGAKAKKLARDMAILEVLFESAMQVTEMLVQAQQSNWTIFGLGGTGTGLIGTGIGTGFAIAYGALSIGSGVLYKYTRYESNWRQTFKDLGSPENFASYYISTKGHYNYFKPNTRANSKLRGISTSLYLKPGIPMFNEKGRTTRVNNREREDSLYLYFGQGFEVEYPTEYINYDNSDTNEMNSSRFLASDMGCNQTTPEIRNISTAYFSLKNYRQDQYGTIDSVRWVPIPHRGRIYEGDECEHMFGGDVRISRVDLKNKFPFFYATAVGVGNRVPFDYADPMYKNVAIPKYYCSYDTNTSSGSLMDASPTQDSDFEFDCSSERGFYVEKPSKIYLYSYGVPYFLVESEINANYRYAGPAPSSNFASNGIDVEEWTQETRVSIGVNNEFRYNQVYSDTQPGGGYDILPVDYSEDKFKKLEYSPNDVIYSNQDNNEQSFDNPWLIYKPYNRGHFRVDYGKLINMKNIESDLVFVLFENQAAIFNAIDKLRERISIENEAIGLGGMFAQRPAEFHKTELGETGTQHKAFVSTEFGHFWADAVRGKINYISPNGQGYKSISDTKLQGGDSGVRKWFKKHLPFQITKVEGLDYLSVDNAYKDVGIVMWWDSKFKRVFITKKDYKPKHDCILWNKEDGFYINETECNGVVQDVECPEGFEFNEQTNMCERMAVTPITCRPGYTFNPKTGTCVREKEVACEEGYEYNEVTGKCIKQTITEVTCNEGYTYNEQTQRCEKTGYLTCPEGYTYNDATDLCEKEVTSTEITEGDVDVIFLRDRSSSMSTAETNIMFNIIEDVMDDVRGNLGALRVAMIDFNGDPWFVGNSVTTFTSDYNNIYARNSQYRGTKGNTAPQLAMVCAKKLMDEEARPGASKKIIILTDGQPATIDYRYKADWPGFPGGLGTYYEENKENGEPSYTLFSENSRDPSKVAMRSDVLRFVSSQLKQDGVEISLVALADSETALPLIVGAYTSTPNPIVSVDENGDYRVITRTFRDSSGVSEWITEGLGGEEEQTTIITAPPSYTGEDSYIPQCEGIIEGAQCISTYTDAPEVLFEFDEYELECGGYIQNGYCVEELIVEPELKDVKTKISVLDEEYFEDVSWTMAYSPMFDSWVSYYDFKPNYAISYNGYFQTGINYAKDKSEKGLWSHLLTNRSFQVFYGKKYPWTIEYAVKNAYRNKVMEVVSLWTRTYRYHNENDYAEWRNNSFNEVVLYNHTNNSGMLKLDYLDTLQSSKYPKTTGLFEQHIPAIHYDSRITFNYFFNRVVNEERHMPIWINDSMNIDKTINPDMVSMKGKRVLERLRGEWFLVRLTQDKSSQFKQVFKWSEDTVNEY